MPEPEDSLGFGHCRTLTILQGSHGNIVPEAGGGAVSLANIGNASKGTGPYSRQLPVKLRLFGDEILEDEDEHDKDVRIQLGEGYP